MTNFTSQIIGCGGYVPDQILTNDDLSIRLETSDDWIAQRTGIRQRHIAEISQETSDLACLAAREALASAGCKAQDVDAIIVATTTADRIFPSTACLVQEKLGIKEAFSFDLQAACSGFVYGLAVSHGFLQTGQARTILLIGAECMSRILDWQDRSTCVLFGDGAGAVVLRAQARPFPVPPGYAVSGIVDTVLYSDGAFADILYVNGGPGSDHQQGVVKMAGREVFKHAVEKMAGAVSVLLQRHGLTGQDIDWFVPHQANLRIIDAMAKKLDIRAENVVVTVGKHANTSAASIPLALYDAVSQGKIKKNDLVLCEALGAGLTWGASLIRW